MAGSRESPGLRDQWRVPKEPRGSVLDRDLDRGHGRGVEHERGRNRARGKFRPGGFDRRSSPPSAHRGPPSRHDITRSRGPSPHPLSNPRVPHHSDRKPSSHPFPAERELRRSQGAGNNPSRVQPEHRSETSASFPKRKRSSSRSPHEAHRDHFRDSRNSGQSFRGRPSYRGKPSRKNRFQDNSSSNHPNQRNKTNRFGPRREDETESNSRFFNSDASLPTTRRNSQSSLSFPRSGSRESTYEGRFERDQSRYSIHSTSSRRSRSISPSQTLKMSPSKPSQSAVGDSKRSPSPPRPIPTLDSENPNNTDGDDRMQDSFQTRPFNMQANQRGRLSRPRLDTRRYSPPQFGNSNSSYHGSPRSGSPHSSGLGGWNSQPGPSAQRGSHSPQYRQNTYSSQRPPQRPSHHNQNQNSNNSRPSSPQRESYTRGDFQDRRFSNQGSQGYGGPASHRGRGHFNNLQWVASAPRGRGGHHSPLSSHSFSGSNTPLLHPPPEDKPPTNFQDKPPTEFQEHEITPNPSSDLHIEDSLSKHGSENGDTQKMPPPNTSTTPAKEGGKFSFAFKTKATPAPATKPVPDLAQRMQIKEPPRTSAPQPPPRAPEPPRNRLGPPPPKFKHDSRQDRRDRDRDFHRGRGREDRRDFRDRNPRDSRRDDRRFDPREDRRRDDHRPDMRQDRHRDRSPDHKKQKKIAKRPNPRPTLPEEYRESDSVYFRKPGNESVIGAGTYGKVFKAIHIYTQGKVALKRIRMEGEKDGFPVTAIREIKLLQHLRHNNIVSLLEVMVEKNECFMVFEYLSHDLTGLINHPSFTLTDAHKKDLSMQMFGGLLYLHHRGVLHRDIKAANILISNRGQLKFADFGLARFFSKSRQLDYTNRVITIWYRPPELLLGDTRYGPAVDIWSAACVFVEMFSKKAVFPGDGREISQLEKLYSSLGSPTRAEWPGIVDMPWVELLGPTERKKRVFEEVYKDILSPAALDLVSKIFHYDPAKRPTAEEVLAHDYFVTEEPGPQQATELENVQGDWHEFESKALRKEKDREARREKEKEKEKRKAGNMHSQEDEREVKRARQDIDDAEDH
ncbi:hypothetical protein BGW36DRAFT_356265 [Talaromyces proteolyticus]|uniref:cyclin-dependent kinase n=1 Tax=Talaromyces proteolyticus TaxID=1131652 RepID=A0AAD4Q3V9_9EURO|nr:uncharacterized protein BGW36DRAFT_356265 [Talaromyces proteolyticus]KAH8702126.1 hypothetical protein BGW36DRAFT_356265 [Talaromyces proteolyticus]